MLDCPAVYKYSGLFQTEETWIHPTRTIDTHEIVVQVAGCAHLYEEDRRFTLQTGEAVVLQAGHRHGGWQSSEGDTSFYWIHFLAEPETLPLLPYEPIKLNDASRMNLLCRQLLHITNTPGYPEYAIQAAFELIFCETARMGEQTYPGTRLVHEIAEWISVNNDRALTVAAVAQHVGYHPDYLSSLFRKTFHMSLKQYIIDQRMQQIRSLLLTTNDSLKQIAERLCFTSENQMLHFFRYHEGISPGIYRNLFHHTSLNRI